MSDEYEAIEPELTPVTFRGRELQLRPLTIGQLPAFARAMRNVLPSIMSDDLDMLMLMAEHGEVIIEAVSIATGLSTEELASSPIEDFVLLARAAVTVNRDFFAQWAAPMLNATSAPQSGDGATHSSS